MKKIFILFLLFTASFAQVLENLSFSEALKLIKEQNLQLSLAKIDKQISSLELSNSKALSFGTIDFIQDFARSDQALDVFGFALSSREASFYNFGFASFLQNSQNPNLLNIKPHDLNFPGYKNYFQSKIQYNLPIFTGGKISSLKKIRHVLQNITTLKYDEISKEILRQLSLAYSNIILIDESLENLALIEKNIQSLEILSKEMQKEGYAKNIDLLEVKVKLSEVQTQIQSLKDKKNLSFKMLSFLVFKEVKSIDKSSFSIPELKEDFDLENANLIKQARHGIQIAQINKSIALGNFMPTLGLNASISSADDKIFHNLSEHKNLSIALRAKLNLFNGFADKNNYEIAKLNLLKANISLNFARESLKLQLAELISTYKSLGYEIKALKDKLKLSKKIYENYQARYKEGLESIDLVLTKQSFLFEDVLKLLKTQNQQHDLLFKIQKLI